MMLPRINYMPYRSPVRSLARAAVYVAFLLQAGSAGGQDIVAIGPGGQWVEPRTAHLALNPVTNRLYSVARIGSETDTVIRFDASTNAVADVLVQPRVAARVTGLEVDAASNALYINYSADRNVEREVPFGIQRLDLNEFSKDATSFIDAPVHAFDLDPVGRRLVGIGEPQSGGTTFEIVTVGLGENNLVSRAISDVPASAYIPRNAVYDAAGERLLVTLQVAQENQPNLIESVGLVIGFDAETGLEEVRSATFPLVFSSHSTALSVGGERLALVGDENVVVLDGQTLETLLIIHKSSISPNFNLTLENAATFSNNRSLWIANSNDVPPEESIAVIDVPTAAVDYFIPNAFGVSTFEPDPEQRKVFAASARLNSLYVISEDKRGVDLHLDLSTIPEDFEADPVQDIFQVLFRSGQLAAIADKPDPNDPLTPHLLSIFGSRGNEPRSGLVNDPGAERVFVGAVRDRPPRVLETVSYHPIDTLPVSADAVAVDASRNLVYAASLPIATPSQRRIYELDGETLEINRVVASMTEVRLSIQTRLRIRLNPETRKLWLQTPLSAFGIGSRPRVMTYDVVSPVSESFVYTEPGIELGDFVLDTPRNRAAVTVRAGSPRVDVIQDTGAGLVRTHSVPLSGGQVSSLASDPEFDLAYFLTQPSGNHAHWSLSAIDLADETPETILVAPLEFMRKTSSARMTFNPTSNRFGVVSFPDAKVYLFDSPVDPGRRPPPGAGGKAVLAITGEVVQTTAGIEFAWAPPSGLPEGEIRGWVIERRLGLGNEEGPDEGWIRLNPVPLPPPFTFWNDTTAIEGATYEYRVRANLLGQTRVDPLLLGPVLAASADSAWRATVPEGTVFLKPGETRRLLVSVSPSVSNFSRVSLDLAGSPEIGASLSRRVLPKPGTAHLDLSSATDTAPGTYLVILQATDTVASASVPLVVRVVKPTQELQTDRIPRAPTTVTLTSDSDLDTARISVRGQIGVLRRLANPTGVFVSAQTPLGEVLAATGVVAPTGEFTAELPIPASGDLSGDWLFRATWPGSLDAVGGSSPVFNFPLLGASANKQAPAALPPSLGQAIVIQGEPAAANQEAGLSRAASAVSETLLARRFSIETGSIQVKSSPTSQELDEVVGGLEDSNYVLIYLLGNAVLNSAKGFGFELNSEEVMTPADLAELVQGVVAKAKPIVVVDAPYAGRFQVPLAPTGGAGIFSANANWSDVVFGENTPIFTNTFMRNIRGGYRLDTCYNYAASAFTITLQGLGTRRPQQTRVRTQPFASLKLGSSFTAPRDLVVDRIPPEFVEVAPTESYNRGSEVPLMARTVDAPFDGPVSVNVEVVFSDGKCEIVPLSSHRSPIAGGGEIHAGTFTAKRNGRVLTIYHAEDSTGTPRSHATTVFVGEGGEYWVGPIQLLDTLWSYYDTEVPACRFGSIIERALRTVRDWHTWVEE